MKKLILTALTFALTGPLFAQFTMPGLKYDYGALEPVMSYETLEYHHGKHVKAYVDKLNQLVPGTEWEEATLEEISRRADGDIFNNGAQILNHIIFFDGFGPEGR